MNRFPLKWKIFVFLLGFCALLLAVLWLFQTVFLDAFYKGIRMSEIKRNAAFIADRIDSADGDSMAEIIADIAESIELVIDITDLRGESVLTPPQDGRIAEMNAALISRAWGGGGEFYEYLTPPQEPPGRPERNTAPGGRHLPMQSLVYVKIADSADGPVAIVIRAVVSPVNATVTTLRYQLYYISGLLLVLAVMLAIVIARRVSKPIVDISRSAMSLAGGRYDTRFAGKGFREIVTLSDTLNTAAVELGRVEGLRRELLANISHDLRTPLALIYSYAEMMHDFPGEITPEQTQVIMDETRRLTTLVNDVLDLSKLENEMETLNSARFNLTKNILETTGRVKELLKNEGFEITFSYDDHVLVNADETKIDRAFYNLLINAVNYSGGKRNVSVTQTVSDGKVKISVTDYGEGIARDDLPLIWDRYYKSGRNHKRAVTGTGLGLSIVKRIIELHGGRYGVATEMGKGSTFWFEIGMEKPNTGLAEGDS